MPMFGADIEALRQLATTFKNKADELDTDVDAVLTQALHSSPWEGPDADAFRSSWSTQLTPRIQEAVAALRTAALDLQRNADEQERASEGEGTGGSVPEEKPTEPPIKNGGGTVLRAEVEFATLGDVGDSVAENGGELDKAIAAGGMLATYIALDSDIGRGLDTVATTSLEDIREASSLADKINFLDSRTKPVAETLDTLGKVATGLQVAGDLISGYDYYSREQGMGLVEAGTHASVYAATKFAVSTAATNVGRFAGAAIGCAVAGPLGGVIGGVIGAAVAPILTDVATNMLGGDAFYRGLSETVINVGKGVGDFFKGLFS